MKPRDRLSAYAIRSMRAGDLEQALALWKRSPGVGLRPDDTRTVLARYLRRNPGISQVAVLGKKIVGTLLGGHDGRRGILAHLAVEEGFQRQGIARRLVDSSLRRLERAGMARSYALVIKGNRKAGSFWRSAGWEQRKDLDLFVSRYRFRRKKAR